MFSVIAEVRRYRSARQMTMNSSLPILFIKGDESRIKLLNSFKGDLTSVTKVESLLLGSDAYSASDEVLIINI